MRLALAALVLAAACTRTTEDSAPAPMQRDDVSLESVRVPPERGTQQISGTVMMSGDGAVTLDSGGPNPVPLWMDQSTKVTVDGKPGSTAQLREGDLLRAAYRMDGSGDALALQVVANTRPPQTPVVKQRQQANPPMQVPPQRSR